MRAKHARSIAFRSRPDHTAHQRRTARTRNGTGLAKGRAATHDGFPQQCKHLTRLS